MPPRTVAPDDWIVWLSLRRNRVLAVAAELAEVSQRQNRPMHDKERAQFSDLNAALVHLDARIRQAKIRRRADPMAPLPRPPMAIPVTVAPRPRKRWDIDRVGMLAPIAPTDVLRPGGSWRRTLGALGPNGR